MDWIDSLNNVDVFEYRDEMLCMVMKLRDALRHSRRGSLDILISNIKQTISLELLCSLPWSNCPDDQHHGDLTEAQSQYNPCHLKWTTQQTNIQPGFTSQLNTYTHKIRNSLGATWWSSLNLPTPVQVEVANGGIIGAKGAVIYLPSDLSYQLILYHSADSPWRLCSRYEYRY